MNRLLSQTAIGAVLVLQLASAGALGALWLRDGRITPTGIAFALLPLGLLLWGVMAGGDDRSQIGIMIWALTMFGPLMKA